MNLDKVWKSYEEIGELNLLEDRREYSLEDLQWSEPTFSQEEINYLYRLIQMNFHPSAGKIYRSNWTSEEALKLAENITESIHQGLDGWTDAEKVIINLYLHDLAIAQGVV